MRTNLTADDVADLLEEPLVAVLATRRPDDTTLLSPVCSNGAMAGSTCGRPRTTRARSGTSNATRG